MRVVRKPFLHSPKEQENCISTFLNEGKVIKNPAHVALGLKIAIYLLKLPTEDQIRQFSKETRGVTAFFYVGLKLHIAHSEIERRFTAFFNQKNWKKLRNKKLNSSCGAKQNYEMRQDIGGLITRTFLLKNYLNR